MVTAQEEMIQRIDSDLDDTLDNTKKAQDSCHIASSTLCFDCMLPEGLA